MKIDNSLEENLLNFWKKDKVYNYSKKPILNSILYKHPAFNTIIILVGILIICNILIELLPSIIININTDMIYILTFLVLIFIVLVLTYNFNTGKNKKLFISRNLSEIYKFLYKNNIRSLTDYEKLIDRLEFKLNKVDRVKLIDDSLSTTIIGVGSFIGGNIFTDYFKLGNIDKYANSREVVNNLPHITMSTYMILLLLSILCICLYKFIVVSFNSLNSEELENLSLLIDDLQKIKLQIEIKESNKINSTNYQLNMTKIEKCNLDLVNKNIKLKNRINSITKKNRNL